MAAPEPFSLDPYQVSDKLGFILPDPLQKLPPYYQPWMDIALRVPELVDSHELRSHINKMPLLSSQFLQRHRELRLAHLALATMSMGYIWQEGEKDIIEMLPRNLAIPLWEVSQNIGFPPILTHADAVLSNWKKRDSNGPFEVPNLELLVSLPGGENYRGFIMGTLLVEQAAAPALKNIPTVINGVRCEDTEAVAKALDVISQSMQEMIESLKLMNAMVDTSVFFGVIRVYLSGWKDNPCLPNGIVYEGVQTEPMKYSGGSAAQSSVIHCFDELLGIKHKGHDGDFLTRMRNYMPLAHKKLIDDISLQPSLKSFVQQQNNERLNETFDKCVTNLMLFRNQHINIVSRFIAVPASRAQRLREKGKKSEEELGSKAPEALETRGTGGSSIMTFLKSLRDDTKNAMLSEKGQKTKCHS